MTINDSNHKQANWLKKEIKTNSQGRIRVDVFPAAQLGKIPRQFEGIQRGTIDGVRTGIIVMHPSKFYTDAKSKFYTDAKHVTLIGAALLGKDARTSAMFALLKEAATATRK